MLQVIIIEDEKPAARRLDRMLQKNAIISITMLHSVAESINWLQNNPSPDLIFLDIQLSDGLSFEIFDSVEVDAAIIFTTAYDEYALKAFKLNSIDYLLKPIDNDELSEAITKYRKIHSETPKSSFDITKIKELLNEEKQVYKERFTIQVGQHLKIIQVNDIECFYSEDKATYAFMKNGKTHLFEGSLETLLPQLNPKLFYRVNRQIIINLHAIKDIISYTNSRLQLKLNTYSQQEIIVSREKVKDFKNWLA